MADNTKDIKVVIGIPTFKRPEGLLNLLNSLAQIQATFVPSIVVADNEGKNGAGIAVVKRLVEDGYPFPLRIVPVEERGISQARNVLLDEAFEVNGADFLAMLDDDETVEPDWIEQLISMQIKTEADVVWGHVVPKFDVSPPVWATGLNIYFREKQADGITKSKCGAGSALLKKSVFRDTKGQKIRFDISFSITGGEDTDYFTRLENDKDLNVKFAFASKAIAYEFIPESRQTKKWALKRCYRIGAGDMRILKLYPESHSLKMWMFQIGLLVAGLLQGALMSVLFFWDPKRQMIGLARVARQLGKLSGLLGQYGDEYKVIHGK